LIPSTRIVVERFSVRSAWKNNSPLDEARQGQLSDNGNRSVGRSGMPVGVSTEPQPLTLSDAVRRAAEAVDPDGGDDRVADFVQRFEDRDEPISSITDTVEMQIAEVLGALDPEGDDPALAMAGAVVTYLAFRRDATASDDERLLQLAADAEYDGHPPDNVAAWLQGVA
jgi:hypothetical protein